MRVKVSDYIAQFLVDHGIRHCFMVVGGGAMYLDDSFGHQQGLACIFNHHEQASAIAAEAYARIDNRIAAVCVTTGPGGTNALTGVLGAWLDSIPMLVLSGQVRTNFTTRNSGLAIRSLGDQEFDICSCASSMTKYCEMVMNPKNIRYCLEKALHLATSGRPGPCWLDIPLDVQGAYIDADELVGFAAEAHDEQLPPPVEEDTVEAILEILEHAERPVFNVGNGIRLAGAFDVFRRVANLLGIPVVTCWDSIDLVEDDHPLFIGRAGIVGDRPGNFAIQNADAILAVGTRLGIRQVGFDAKAWAPRAHVIMSDICADELRKPTVHVETPVWSDARDLLEKLEVALLRRRASGAISPTRNDWMETCRAWKRDYPVLLERHRLQKRPANLYALIDELSLHLGTDQVTVAGSGATSVAGAQGYRIQKGSRFILSSAVASLGYDLPAAIGACIAQREMAGADKDGALAPDTILFTGDGGIQFNLQELQVIVHHRLPIKIFIVNNQGYHSIRQTQDNVFGGHYVGIGPDSGDISFPDMSKIAYAYGIPYVFCEGNDELACSIDRALSMDGPVICEVMTSTDQPFEPKSATTRLEDGTLVSLPLEDLAPFLPRDELARVMSVSAR